MRSGLKVGDYYQLVIHISELVEVWNVVDLGAKNNWHLFKFRVD